MAIKNFTQFSKSNKKVDTPPEKYPEDDITKKDKPEPVVNKPNVENVGAIKLDEAVTKINDEFKVKTMYSVPASLIKEYIEKVKTDVGKNPLEFWGAGDIAEEMVKYVLNQYLKIDNVPAAVVFGDDRTQDEEDATAEGDEIEVTDAEGVPEEEDFNQDKAEEDVPIEEEEMFGMTESLTDADIVFKKS